MEVIARHLGTSRSTVSRLIKRARDTGLVEITLRPASTRAPGLGQGLGARFGISAYVVPVPDSAAHDRPARGRRAHVRTPARVVVRLRHGHGRRLGHHPRGGEPEPAAQADPGQLGGPAQRGGQHPHERHRVRQRPHLELRVAFDAAVHHFPVPAFFDFPDTKAAMWRERSVRRVLDVQRRADIALFSVGAVAGAVPSHVYSAGLPRRRRHPRCCTGEGVVGDVCTVFLRADGSYADVALNAPRDRADAARAAPRAAPGLRRGRRQQGRPAAGGAARRASSRTSSSTS